MYIFDAVAEAAIPRLIKRCLVGLAISVILITAGTQDLFAQDDAQAPTAAAAQPPYTQQAAEQLQQLVAPIALYPDSLVAQILAASTFPEQVVEANRWVQAHGDLQGGALAQAVDQQPWDPSVKALTAFPSVLGNMDQNLAWTSSLGDAYYNQQPDVMDAIQAMRQRAEEAGNLKTTPQQSVATQEWTRSSFNRRAPISSTFPPMIHGWLTAIPWWRGRVGTRIPGFGTTVPISRLESALESAFLEGSGGDGEIGDWIGITDTPCTTTGGITPAATLSITGAIITARAVCVACNPT